MESLAQEELSEGEVRAVLERLAAGESMPEQSTVGDVCELTEVSPVVVGRILADIRQTSFEALYLSHLKGLESRVDHHARILRKHEARLDSLTQQSHQQAVPAISPSVVRNPAGTQSAQDMMAKRLSTVVAAVFLFIAFAIFLVLINTVGASSPNRGPEIVGRATFNGKLYQISRDGKAYEERDGKLERARGQEASMAEFAWKAQSSVR